MIIRMTVLILLVSLGGCGGYTWVPPKPNDPAYAPTVVQAPSVLPNFSGSVYQTDYGLDSLYTDLRAYKIGDVLTVTLDEQTSADKSANTTSGKTTTNNKTNPTLFGSTPQFNLPNYFPLASTTDNTLQFDVNATSSFSGDGTSKQNNNLQGSITVTVSNVFANGNLEIRGEKWITLNQGSEFIRLTGIVRPYDIDADNTVKSTKVANPRITYSGTGALAEANQEGWFSRLLNGPVAPY